MRAGQNELMKPLPIAKALEPPLRKGTSPPFIKHVSLTSWFQMRIPLCSPLFSMPGLRYVLGGLGEPSRG